MIYENNLVFNYGSELKIRVGKAAYFLEFSGTLTRATGPRVYFYRHDSYEENNQPIWNTALGCKLGWLIPVKVLKVKKSE